MAGESIQFENGDDPKVWQNILGGIARDFGQAAINRFAKDDAETRATQQAPVASSELRTWIPWIIGGVLVLVLLLKLKR